MRVQKSPQLKKQDEYTKDHRVSAKRPKLFRKSWPLKKAIRRRKYRHQATQLLQHATMEPDLDSLSSECKAAKPREALRKWGACCLRVWIDGQREQRRTLAGRKARRFRIAFVRELGGKRLNCVYNMVIEWSKEDQIFVVSLPEFGPHARTHGVTFDEAVEHGCEAVESLIEAYQADGRPLPPDRTVKVLSGAAANDLTRRLRITDSDRTTGRSRRGVAS